MNFRIWPRCIRNVPKVPKEPRTICTHIQRYRGEITKCRLKARKGGTRCHMHSPPPIE